MKDEPWPLSESPFAQVTWPANGCVALVLDGASIPNIDQSIYEWSGGIVEAECLYASTRWEPVSEFAPWLVWLDREDNPAVKPFLEEGAGKEWGYFLLSGHPPAVLREYLHQLLAIERVPDSPELLRIAHPELARSIIGEQQISPAPQLPSDVVQNVISPDCVDETWVIQAPPHRPNQIPDQAASPDAQRLDATFSAFNRRKDNLSLWDQLDPPMREWLGGQHRSVAFPALARLAGEAEQQGHRNPRDKLRFLAARYHNDDQARIDTPNAHTFMDEQ
ncbi:DUF4123 domain-containing protein [Marinobacter halodurans]|uniref:DUF4123 domain-containing protein n=1 Tax=Marinobacter halodurans TaxID=2528979 RepID=A0ABY1ZDK7_9GAMM|nr:DUF4123 domain-containing protein [Marinobacter halodurans]TBW47436.1 DUF4123 domain-containing protein [Marinobacter halodurans]